MFSSNTTSGGVGATSIVFRRSWGLRTLPDVVFEPNIPLIMSVASALVLKRSRWSGCYLTNSKLTCDFLGEFQNIMLDIVGKSSSPCCPSISPRYLLQP